MELSMFFFSLFFSSTWFSALRLQQQKKVKKPVVVSSMVADKQDPQGSELRCFDENCAMKNTINKLNRGGWKISNYFSVIF
jgi:hypothetical protein